MDSTIKVKIPKSVMQAELSTTNGGIRISEISKPEMVKAHTTNGSIHFEELDAKDIMLKTSNAPVKGTLRGKSTEYAIESGTSNGKNSLPSKWNQSDPAAKCLSVHTSNANIKVEF